MIPICEAKLDRTTMKYSSVMSDKQQTFGEDT